MITAIPYAAIFMPVCAQSGIFKGMRMNIGNRTAKQRIASNQALMSCGELSTYTNFSLESPFSARLPMEKGKAAPIANRKKGKTRSTHVMPGKEGLNI